MKLLVVVFACLLAGCTTFVVDRQVNKCLDEGRAVHYLVRGDAITFDCR